MSKMILAPRIAQPGMPGFLLWARRDNPSLYAQLRTNFPAVAQFEQTLQVDQGLEGFADILKSVGSSLSKSAKSIGAFVAKNALPIATVAVPLIVAKKQADVAKAQVKLAIAQQPPMQTAYQYDSAGNIVATPVRQTLQTGLIMEGGEPLQRVNAARQKLFNVNWSTSIGGVPLWGVALAAGGWFVYRLVKK